MGKTRRNGVLLSLACALCVGTVLFGAPQRSAAETADELRAKIEERNHAIEELEKEISAYQTQLETTGKETDSLKKTIRELDLTRKKLLTEIRVTENRIGTATLSIETLGGEIAEKEKKIGVNSDAIEEAMRRVDEAESTSFIETILNYDRFSDLWDGIETLVRFRERVSEDLTTIQKLKKELEAERGEEERRKRELSSLRTELGDRKRIVEGNTAEKNTLLAETKNKEANFKRILAEKFALRDAFERELLEFESQLRFEIDPTRIPSAGSGILAWPLDLIKITQYFGNTAFSQSRPQVYNGFGHNGVDFRASVGTRVKAALSGTIAGIGDTDGICPGASYGKWVLIEHGNGLSTLYAHLSLIRAAVGENVQAGDTVGYSGNTGYSTGPHLHFSVYATQGVKILTRKSRVCGGSYTMPVADWRAYLNPLSYL